MNTFNPLLSLSTSLEGRPARKKAVTPGDVGDSLFQTFLQKLNTGRDAEETDLALLSWMGLDPPSGGEATAGGTKGDRSFLRLLAGSHGKLELPDASLPLLRGFLKDQGLATGEIDQLLRSLTMGEGGIRLDRLLAKLSGFLQKESDSGPSLVVESANIPRVEEALFKMGLTVEQVNKAVQNALNAKGGLDLDRLAASLDTFFTDVGPDTGARLAMLFSRQLGIPVRPETTEHVAQQTGLERAIERITKDATGEAQAAVKREIAALLREKGLPPQEVKRFLETLSVRSTGNGSSAGPAALPDEYASRILLRKDSGQAFRPEWKEQVLNVLKQEDTLSGNPNRSGGESGSLSRNLAELLKEWVSAHRSSDARSARGGISLSARTSAEKGAAFSLNAKGGQETQGKASVQPATGSELSVFRAERASSPQPGASIRNTAPAAPLPEPLPKVVDRMVWMVRSGEQTSRLQIRPPELGRLDLDLVIRQGHVSAHLNAENPMVKELIEANLQQLRQQLNNLGLTVERFEVHAGLDDRRFADGQGRAGGRNGGKGNGKGSGPESKAPAVDAVSTGRNPGRSLHQIDVRV